MVATKKKSARRSSLTVFFAPETHQRLVVLQGQYQAKHGVKIYKAVLAGLALDATIDKYIVE